jgi:hypothetical protein
MGALSHRLMVFVPPHANRERNRDIFSQDRQPGGLRMVRERGYNFDGVVPGRENTSAISQDRDRISNQLTSLLCDLMPSLR